MLLLKSISHACILLAGHACPLYVFTMISMAKMLGHFAKLKKYGKPKNPTYYPGPNTFKACGAFFEPLYS